MYSGSRGILYTAPPAADESTDDADAASTETADETVAADGAADEEVPADD